MPGLLLKLRPHEQLMINGVIIENGDRRAFLRVKTDGANILRMRHALSPETATTPLKRAYFTAQKAVGGQLADHEAHGAISLALADCAEDITPEARDDLDRSLAEKDYYAAMRRIGDLIDAREAAE